MEVRKELEGLQIVCVEICVYILFSCCGVKQGIAYYI